MSLLELLNEIGKLAQLVNEKNQELENLRKDYDAKLQVINQYIENLSLSGASSPSSITDVQLIRELCKPIDCPNCNYRVWKNDKESQFLLLPKNMIERESQITVEDKSPKVQQRPLPSPPASNRPSKSKSKIECSYCKKTGHVRAKCKMRLNTPVTTNNNNP